MRIRSFTLADVEKVKEFTDANIGPDYYSVEELQEIYKRSVSAGQEYTLLLEDENFSVRGVRISFPPGQWQHGKGHGLNPQLWNLDQKDVAYFQSLFIDAALTGQGWGKKLSRASLQMLKASGAQGVITHSWKESPHDSSGRYLRALGFQFVASHPEYWKGVDYTCLRCGKPCVCTAEEMILYL